MTTAITKEEALKNYALLLLLKKNESKPPVKAKP